MKPAAKVDSSASRTAVRAFGAKLCRKVLISWFLCALCASAVASRGFAQGCAMCYTTAAAAGAAAARSLDLGILILLVPALTVFVSVVVLLIRRAHATA